MDREGLLQRTAQARVAFEDHLEQVEVAKRQYHEHVRELAAAGMSLREIAAELGLSHQRVHQIVSEKPAASTRGRAVTAAVAGTVMLLAAVVVGTRLAGDPSPWAPVHGADGSVVQAQLSPPGLERFGTPEQAVVSAVTDAYSELERVNTEVVVRFADDVALDARVQVTAPGFCRIYSASGEQLDGSVDWTAFGDGIPCSPSGA